MSEKNRMNNATRAAGYLRTAMLFMALALPAGSLIVLGTLWLWENGFILQWALGAGVVALAVYGSGRSFLKEATANRHQLRDLLRRSDPLWTEREAEAWEVVRTIANDVDPDRLNSRNAFLALGTRTVEAVGQSMFSGEDNPLWRFTVPELLVLVRRVSAALDPVVRENIPYGDSLTVGQAMTIYQWRSVIGVTEAAYDVWNLIQKPASAAQQGTQEQASRRLHDRERNELGRRIASAYVREVGRAAIDLYSGRLRPLSETPAGADAKATEDGETAPQEKAKPLRILVGGQVAAGKSSLVSALLRAVNASVDALAPTKGLRAYELKREGVAEVLLIDSPGIEADDVAIESLKTQAQHCDLLLWVTSAMGPERGRDRKVLDALRLAAKAERRYPPVLGVHTHIDQLQPILEWSSSLQPRSWGEPQGAVHRQGAARGRLGPSAPDPIGGARLSRSDARRLQHRYPVGENARPAVRWAAHAAYARFRGGRGRGILEAAVVTSHCYRAGHDPHPALRECRAVAKSKAIAGRLGSSGRGPRRRLWRA